MGNTKDEDQWFTEEEAARRRDEVVRRMVNTPPSPRPTRPGKRTSVASDKAARASASRDRKP
jgi:hypothetical protein